MVGARGCDMIDYFENRMRSWSPMVERPLGAVTAFANSKASLYFRGIYL